MPLPPPRRPKPTPKTSTEEKTFLEYVIESALGPRAQCGQWCCPFHCDTDPSFAVLPHRPELFKDRWKCRGCGQWGDEFDFLRLYYDDEGYSRRIQRMELLRRRYAKRHGPTGFIPSVDYDQSAAELAALKAQRYQRALALAADDYIVEFAFADGPQDAALALSLAADLTAGGISLDDLAAYIREHPELPPFLRPVAPENYDKRTGRPLKCR